MSTAPDFPKQLPTRIALAEHARVVYHIETPPGHTLDHVMAPQYWKHLHTRLNIADRVEVIAQDASYFAELMVIGKSPLGLTLSPITVREFGEGHVDAAPDGAPGDLVAIYRGQRLNWCVERGDERLQKNLNSKGDALNWIDQRVRVEAA